MQERILAIAVFTAVLIPFFPAEAGDFQSATGHYDQYSNDNINTSFSQSSQYSASGVSNPYSQYEVQYAPKNVIEPFAQAPHDYKANLVTPESSAKKAQAKKKAAQEQAAVKFLETKKTGRIPVFLLLLFTSSLALAATIFIIIGLFKK